MIRRVPWKVTYEVNRKALYAWDINLEEWSHIAFFEDALFEKIMSRLDHNLMVARWCYSNLGDARP
jgi:hypothetical protein